MMRTEKEHPIVPSDALVQQWFLSARAMPPDQWVTDIAHKAAAWAADKELEACCEWLVANDWKSVHQDLCAARRPKPPSHKELALIALTALEACAAQSSDTTESVFYIRRALESLPE